MEITYVLARERREKKGEPTDKRFRRRRTTFFAVRSAPFVLHFWRPKFGRIEAVWVSVRANVGQFDRSFASENRLRSWPQMSFVLQTISFEDFCYMLAGDCPVIFNPFFKYDRAIFCHCFLLCTVDLNSMRVYSKLHVIINIPLFFYFSLFHSIQSIFMKIQSITPSLQLYIFSRYLHFHYSSTQRPMYNESKIHSIHLNLLPKKNIFSIYVIEIEKH